MNPVRAIFNGLKSVVVLYMVACTTLQTYQLYLTGKAAWEATHATLSQLQQASNLLNFQK